MKIIPQLNVKYSEFKSLWDIFKHRFQKRGICNRWYSQSGPFIIKWDISKNEKVINFIIVGNDWKIKRHLKLPIAYMDFISSKRVFRELLEQIV